jgi:LPXTG-motif cell wall-anchored protein
METVETALEVLIVVGLVIMAAGFVMMKRKK